MDLGVYNASIRYEDTIYNDNKSGIVAEQSNLLKKMHATNTLPNEHYLLQSNGTPADRMVYDDEENFVIKHFETSDSNSVAYEVITVDPNCFYSSDDDDIVVDIECVQSETNTEHDSESSAESGNENQYPLMTQPIVLGSVKQPSKATTMEDISFDITNVNITDLCAVDDHLLHAHDDILFAHGTCDIGQFDLANYVDGGGPSLLLSPPPLVIARQRTPIKVTPARAAVDASNRSDVRREVDVSTLSNEQQYSESIMNVHPATIAGATNGNCKKRRNLTKVFIDITDSDSDNDAAQIKEEILPSKKQRRRDDDSVWHPVPNGNSKTIGKAKIDATKDTSTATKSDEMTKEKRNEKLKPNSTTSSTTTDLYNGLRTMLKKQLLSNRPMNPMKINKMLASPVKSTTSNASAVNGTKRKLGVGRGKDISITAKYFNSSAKSSDNSGRDNTDNDIINLGVESSSESESNASKNSVQSKERAIETEKFECEIAKDSVVAAENGVAEKRSKELKETIKQATTKGPVLMDNVDFAKAIFVDAKEAAKVKPVKRYDFKRSASEQPLKLSTILFNTSNKFKTNCLPTVVSSRPFTELRAPNSNPKLLKAESLTDLCAKSAIKLPRIPLRRQIKVKPKIEENCVEQTKMEIDVVSVDKAKSDAMAATTSKKKLNIQEYLKRKSINPLSSAKVKMCREEHSYGKPAETAAEPTIDENCHASNSETSLYEEIITVSMGCGTDISIPELRVDGADASTATVLLSNIQTTIEKANAAIELGKISSNSLISSIQDVILKKRTIKMETEDCVDGKKPPAKNEEYEHGENKVITHLRKDRVRLTTVTIATQTDPYFQFPPLERFMPHSRKTEHFDRCKSLGRSSVGDTTVNDNRSMRTCSVQQDRFLNRNYRSRKDHSESSYYSDDGERQQQISSPQRRSRHSEYLESIAQPSAITNGHIQVRRRHERSDSYKKSRRYRSKYDRDTQRHRTISRSLSQSSETSSSSRTSTSTYNSSATSVSSKSLNSYGDGSAKSYYGDDHCDRRRNRSTQNWPRGARNQQMSSHRSDSPEHRRIVYVGRIESETTKDDLRRIFSVYGRVENVTIHYKEMKWKYGFVTFERPVDAYKVIDTSSKNPALKNYDISFGGRRAFCREKYLDLDNTEDGYSQKMHPMAKQPQYEDDSFEALLRKLKEKLQDTKE